MTASGERLPAEVREVTAFDIVMGAAASRDWQPQHHDADHARTMNLPNVIMNTPTQTGWFHAYAMAWAGPRASIGRWKLKMLRPVCPGMTVEISGVVADRQAASAGREWIWIDLRIEASSAILSTMQLLVLRAADAGAARPAINSEPVLPLLRAQS